jgi:hypothetical protein
LKLGKPVADASVDAETKGQMLTRSFTINNEAVGLRNRRLVAVARQVPHRQLIALANLLATQLRVDERASPHVGQRRLPADDLGHKAVDQRRIGAQLGHFLRMLVQGQ